MFANFGTKVTIFEAAPQFLPREDWDIAQAITRILQEKGVELILNANVQAVSSKEGAVQVETPEGAHLVDALLVGVGAKTGDGWLTVAERRRGGERTRRDHRG
ncbi:pyridine nucleotide-disulfide oxidoreductase [Salmonella enterica subsp. enterica]|nr:pyridine nucleotide-disulfide oxidoreductase [Salmonella enterica subsp. enterica] [Salmonella enterica subsp. enterica serovar Menston]